MTTVNSNKPIVSYSDTFHSIKLNLGKDAFFQKVSKVIFSVLEGLGLIFQRKFLPKVELAAKAVNDLQNFFSFGKLPRTWKSLITADKIDDNELQKSIRQAIVNTGKLYDAQTNNPKKELLPTTIAKEIVKEHLTFMIKGDVGYKNVEELKKALHEKLSTRLWKAGIEKTETDKISITISKTTVKETPFLSKVSKLSFAILDILAIKYYLTEWNLYPSPFQKMFNFIGLGKQATQLGETKVFQCLSGEKLVKTLWAFVSIGFALQTVEAARQLDNPALSKNEKKQLRWESVYSLAETVLGVASYLEVKKTVIIPLALVSNTIGILKTIYSPPRAFFEHLQAI